MKTKDRNTLEVVLTDDELITLREMELDYRPVSNNWSDAGLQRRSQLLVRLIAGLRESK